MKTATRLDDLQVLGDFLQDRLQLELPHSVPFQVQCVPKDGALIILAQHPPGFVPDPQQTFKVLEEAVTAEQPESPYQVKLYLRVAGQKRPYAFNTFTVEPRAHSRESVVSNTTTNTQQTSNNLENPFNWDRADEIDTSAGKMPESVDGSHSRGLGVEALTPESPSESQIADEPVPKANPWDQPIPDLGLSPDDVRGDTGAQESFRAESNSPTNGDQKAPDTGHASQARQNTNHWSRSLLPILAAGTGIAAMFFFCSLYVLTRPCVLGSCTQIAAAEQLSRKSAQILQQPKSGKEILLAQQHLTEAIGILQSIPYWSGHYKDAQNRLSAYQAQAKKLDEVVTSLKKAAKASVKSQNPPHSTSEWLEIQKLWREATLELEQVPKNSNVYKLAQQKQRAYKVNLAVVNKRLTVEQKAKQYLEVAKEAAKKAEARQGVAQSLESWYLVYATWQMAVKRLFEIPQGTTAHEEGQQLLTDYQTKLANVRDRTIQEQFAANIYKQSMRIAQQARKFQAISQWSQAVIHWNSALSYLKYIPNGTFYHTKANLLMSSYTEDLKKAQAQLQLATRMQQASSDLKQTCSGKPQICNFMIASDVIKVRLTPAYMQKVRNAALSAKVRNDYNAQAGVVKHVLTLGEALEAISDNARIRLEVYTPDGSLRQAHNP